MVIMAKFRSFAELSSGIDAKLCVGRLRHMDTETLYPINLQKTQGSAPLASHGGHTHVLHIKSRYCLPILMSTYNMLIPNVRLCH